MARHPLRAALFMTCAAVTLAACGKKTPEDLGTPTAAAPVAAGPSLSAVAPKVEYKVSETDPATEIDAGESVTVTPGANILIGENGHGALAWPEFLSNDLYSGTDSLISLSVPERRQAFLDQASGTARYQVAGDGAAEVKVRANWIEVKVASGPADFVISYIPGADPTAWVVMLDGTATVDPVRAEGGGASATTATSVTLRTGEAAAYTATAFTAEGALPKPLGIDPTQVKAWLERLGTGSAKTSIAGVAFRCEIKGDDVGLRDTPSEDAEAGEAIPAGTVVVITERDDTASWLKVRLLDGTEEGWLPVDALTCLAPPADAPVASEEGVATPTQRPLPTRNPFAVPITTPLPTPTYLGTPSPTPTVALNIKFSADKTRITAGECVNFSWEVENIDAVYFNGKAATGKGSSKECPPTSATYTLRVILRGGAEEKRSIEIKVVAKDATSTQAVPPTNTNPPPPATNTPVPPPATETDEPPTSVPPAPATSTPVPATPVPATPEPATPEPATPEPQPTTP